MIVNPSGKIYKIYKTKQNAEGLHNAALCMKGKVFFQSKLAKTFQSGHPFPHSINEKARESGNEQLIQKIKNRRRSVANYANTGNHAI